MTVELTADANSLTPSTTGQPGARSNDLPPDLRRLTTRRAFSQSELQEFLTSGWFLSVPSRDSRQVLVGWGPLRTHAYSPVTGPGDAALFAPDFRLRSARPWISSRNWDFVDRAHLAQILQSRPASLGEGFHWQEPPRALFDERFQTISSRFRSGQLDKAVPVVFSTADAKISPDTRLHILQNLSQLPDHLIIYGFWGHPDGDRIEQGMVGVTPELLFSLVGDAGASANSSASSSATASCLPVLETAALAATRAKPKDPALIDQEAQALFDDPKERAEHQFVIDDITSVLRPYAQVEVGSTRVLELPTLFHLKTSIRARLSSPLGIDQAAELLHPTPALGFAPRALGIGEMDHWDDSEFRWRYGAPFGVDAILYNRARPESPVEHIQECVVAIRNIQWQGMKVRLGSGCGVVRASQVDREWQELQLKRDSVKRILGIESNGVGGICTEGTE